MEKVVIFHSTEYLRERFFEDCEGDIWEKREYRDYYTGSYMGPEPMNYGIGKCYSAASFPGGVFISEFHSTIGPIKWAVKEVGTRETHPEYFV